MTSQQINLFNNDQLNVTIKTITDNDNVIWFRAKDIALYLGYKNTVEAIRRHVDDKYKNLLCNIEGAPDNVKHVLGTSSKSPIYIKEFGLYQLIFKSNLSDAKVFTEWVIEDVIPSIRKTGKYILYEQPILLDKQISLKTERDLHFKVIDYIKKYYPHALLYAGLGELQDTVDKRIYSKRCGYIKGQSDIIINNLHKHYNGLTIELKTPNGRGILHDTQQAFLNMSQINGHKVIISNDYDEILTEIINYMNNTRMLCTYCSRKFKNNHTLNNHCRIIHRITNV
jgi:prophage antirepressor-like protein